METREKQTVKVSSAENCETKQVAKGSWCRFLPVCTVRTRIAILLTMFCLQAPFLLYYMSSVDLSNILILKSYGSSLRIFSNYSKDDIKAVANSSTVFNTINNTITIYNSTLSEVANSNTKKLTTLSTTAITTARTNATALVNERTEGDGAILPLCPEEPPNLQGRLEVSFKNPPETFAQIAVDNSLLKEGGHGKPPYCKSRQKVALIIPFRDRSEHLRYFLQYMHPALQRQEVDYQIFIINQDDRCLYWCSDKPRHMSAAVDKFNYVLPYSAIFGGVVLVSKEQTEKGNGFSNSFWGWGGEDDDFRNRLTLSGYKIIRYPNNIARYKMISHKREKGNEPNPKRFSMIQKTKATMQTDGLNSLKYKVIEVKFERTYTNITVDIFPP